MQAPSINTTNVETVRVISFQYTRGAHLNMFRVLLSACVVPAVVSIIVTDPPPTSTEYNYSYNIVNPRTGDTKSLYEKRTGDVVTGSYSVIDPDGTQRVVEYTADSRRGFKAVVRSEPLAIPFHHAVHDPYYFSGRNTHYLNQPFSSHTQYRGHPLSEPFVMKTLTSQGQQKNNNEADPRQTRYFTPSNEVKSETAMSFKSGEYFAPNN